MFKTSSIDSINGIPAVFKEVFNKTGTPVSL